MNYKFLTRILLRFGWFFIHLCITCLYLFGILCRTLLSVGFSENFFLLLAY